MARAKNTIQRDSVFRSTGATPPAPLQGIPAQEAPSRQTGVWLTDTESQWLEEQCLRIRQAGWRTVTRSALIRALIRAKMEEKPSLEGVIGEAELTERLKTPR
jgi:hypothetical protein